MSQDRLENPDTTHPAHEHSCRNFQSKSHHMTMTWLGQFIWWALDCICNNIKYAWIDLSLLKSETCLNFNHPFQSLI